MCSDKTPPLSIGCQPLKRQSFRQNDETGKMVYEVTRSGNLKISIEAIQKGKLKITETRNFQPEENVHYLVLDGLFLNSGEEQKRIEK